MRGNLLTILGVGVPMLLMLALWRVLNSPSVPAASSAQKPAEARKPASRPTEDRQALNHWRDGQSLPPATVPAAESTGLTTVLDDYLDHWEQALRRDPELQRAAAGMLLKQGRYEQALVAFDRLLAKRADDAVLITGKAMALTGLQKYEDAVALLENVARREKKNVAAQFNYAVALMRSGDRSAAIQTLHHVLELAPQHAKARFNLAVLLQAMGQSNEALELWRQITDQAKKTQSAAEAKLSTRMLTDAWSHRGELALQTKQAEEAENCFHEAIELEPRNAAGWCNLGIARAEQVHRADALTALRIALQLDPMLVPALNQTAYLEAANYRDSGDVNCGRTVIECCRRSLKLKPDQPNIAALERAARAFDASDTGEKKQSGNPK